MTRQSTDRFSVTTYNKYDGLEIAASNVSREEAWAVAQEQQTAGTNPAPYVANYPTVVMVRENGIFGATVWTWKKA